MPLRWHPFYILFTKILSNIIDNQLVLCYNDAVKYNLQGGAMNEKMKQARLEKNLSQTELAKIIGVSRQTINMIENGDYNPTIALCRNICKVLGCTLNDLFWEDK